MTYRNLIRLLLIVCTLTIGIPVAGSRPDFGYVANSGSNTVSVINLHTDRVIATIRTGPNPGGIAMNPGGTRVWVAGTNGTTIEIDEIATATNSVVARITALCPSPGRCSGYAPNSIAFTPDGKTAYLVNNFIDPVGGTVFVINVATNQISKSIQVGHFPSSVAITPDGRRAYVTNSEDFSVSVIDTSTNRVVALVGPTGNPPEGIAVASNGTHVYVPYCAPPAVAVIDTKTNSITATINAPRGSCPVNIAFAQHSRLGYITEEASNALSVIDALLGTVVTTITLGPVTGDNGVAVLGKRVYVTNRNNVVVIDTSTNRVIDTISVGSGPSGIAVRPLP